MHSFTVWEIANLKKYNDKQKIAVKELIKENQHLFWYTPSNKKEDIDEDQLVETILNYGEEMAIKQLIEGMA